MSGLKADDCLDLRAAPSEVGFTRPLLRPVLDHLFSIDEQAAEPCADQFEGVGPGFARGEASSAADRKPLWGDGWREFTDPLQLRGSAQLRPDSRTREIGGVEILDAESMLGSLRASKQLTDIE